MSVDAGVGGSILPVCTLFSFLETNACFPQGIVSPTTKDAIRHMDSLFACDSLDSVRAWCKSPVMADITEVLRQGTASDRKAFRSRLFTLRRRLHPLSNHPLYNDLLAQFHSQASEGAKHDLGRQLVAIQTGVDDAEYLSTFGVLDAMLAEVSAVDLAGATGRSNRAKRALPANQLFTRAAGVLRPDGAVLDSDGNAAGSENDLGQEGAFQGLKIVVVQQYTEDAFNFAAPRAALEEKGFEVCHLGDQPSLEVLKEHLSTANQFWIISADVDMLTGPHIEAIVDEWNNGMGVYVYGDNNPFFKDANRLLKAMGLPSMNGNYAGDKHLRPFSVETCTGYITHAITTGLSSRLYEGITIAEFNPQEISTKHCTPAVYNSRGGVSVIVCEARGGRGQVIVDGAFTKLYCGWDTVGSARFVKNCACFLAADMSVDNGRDDTGPTAASLKERVGYDFTGALTGCCDISFDDGPLAILASELGDDTANTTDFALDEPLAMGYANRRVLGAQVYAFSTGVRMLQIGEDPFRRSPVVGVLPVVRLNNTANFQLFKSTLCQVYMGGRDMCTPAWLIFLACCDDMLGRGVGRPEVWQHFIREVPTSQGWSCRGRVRFAWAWLS